MVTTSIANVFAFITLTGNTELAKSILPPTSLTLVKNTKSPVLLPCAVADTVTVFALNATVKALDTVTDTDTGVMSTILSPSCSKSFFSVPKTALFNLLLSAKVIKSLALPSKVSLTLVS